MKWGGPWPIPLSLPLLQPQGDAGFAEVGMPMPRHRAYANGPPGDELIHESEFFHWDFQPALIVQLRWKSGSFSFEEEHLLFILPIDIISLCCGPRINKISFFVDCG
jgi:hypothetical protein